MHNYHLSDVWQLLSSIFLHLMRVFCTDDRLTTSYTTAVKTVHNVSNEFRFHADDTLTLVLLAAIELLQPQEQHHYAATTYISHL